MRSLLALFSFGFLAMSSSPSSFADAPRPADAPTPSAPAQTESLVLGGGCFWCVEAAFELVPGVLAAESGYAGGQRPNPSYEQVCTGATGHAEVVKITFDPAVVKRGQLLDFFWDIHDPTTLNRQGADAGTQYRSVIYYASSEEKSLIDASLAKANAESWNGKIEDSHRGFAFARLLSGRGVSSGLLQEEPVGRLLQSRHQAQDRQAQEGAAR
jgi:methionine-S-sulfoxide reductase